MDEKKRMGVRSKGILEGKGMNNFASGFITCLILSAMALGLIIVDYQREYRRIEDAAYSSCQDARDRAHKFGKERSALYAQINRMKR